MFPTKPDFQASDAQHPGPLGMALLALLSCCLFILTTMLGGIFSRRRRRRTSAGGETEDQRLSPAVLKRFADCMHAQKWRCVFRDLMSNYSGQQPVNVLIGDIEESYPQQPVEQRYRALCTWRIKMGDQATLQVLMETLEKNDYQNPYDGESSHQSGSIKDTSKSEQEHTGASNILNVDAPNRPNVDALNAGAPNRLNIDERLLLRISKEGSPDWKQLAINLGLSTAEIDRFEADNRNNLMEQCRRMLVAWCRKQGGEEEARQGLINALEETGRMDLVHLLGESLSSRETEEAADRCEEELKKWYTDAGGYVQMHPWEDEDKRPIGDMYTELHLVKGKDDGIQGEVESYRDMFGIKRKDGHLVKRVICEGQAGLGKTTLLDKIAYDWAKGNNEVLKQFKLVFVLKFSALRQDSDLVAAIFDQLLPEDAGVDQSHLNTFIRDNPDKVLVLMDGFDEFITTNINANETFGTVLKLLNRKVNRECFVIVTTRPSHYATLTSTTLIVKPFALVNVTGFTRKNVQRYVERYYENEESKGRGLWDRIKSSSLLHELATSPMLLLLMCLLWNESSALPETMSRLYFTGIEYIFGRKGPDKLKVHVADIIIKLGKVALSGLTSPEQRLSFKETEFDKNDLDIAITAGILTRQRVRKGFNDVHNSIQFIHKTFQEYCAAKYCQNLFQNDPHKFRETFANCNLVSLEYLLRFCCGDNSDCTDAVLQLLVEKQMDVEKKRKLGLACFYESQADALPSEAFLNVVFQQYLKLEDYGIEGVQSFLYLLKIAVDQDNDMVHRVEGFGCFNLSASSLTWVEVDHLMRGMPNLIGLDLLANGDLGGKGAPWSQLKEMKHLKTLNLYSCSLTGDDLKAMAVPLSSIPNLAELNLTGNKALGGKGAPWSQLKEMKHLQKLTLRSCSLTGDDLKAMAVPLSSMPNLAELNLSGNKDLGGKGAPWSQLKEMKHLQWLTLYSCSLTGDDLKAMAVPLSSMPNLTELNLSHNEDLGGVGAPWSQLKEMRHLQTLNLCWCSLTGDDLKAMAVPLSSMPNLVVLDVSHNAAIYITDEIWSHLKKMKHLQVLILPDGRKLTGEDLRSRDMHC